MASEWPPEWTRVRLGDVADVNWGDTSTTKASYVPSGFAAYSASGRDGFLPHADVHRTGVVLSAIGADCGKTWLAKGDWSCIKNTIRFWSTNPDVDTEFLYWLTRTPSIWPRRGSAQPFISQGDARALRIAYPSLPEQLRITSTLGAIDDKIELNWRVSQTLESMTKALFKSWFVDFDPVRAKAGGRDTGLPESIASLFPRSFVDCEIGEIPTGWRVAPLGTIGHLAIGGAWGEDAQSPGTVEAVCLRGVDLEHLRRDGVARAPRRWFKPSTLGPRSMDDCDVLIAGSGAGPTGRPLWMSPVLARNLGPSTYSNFCKRLRCGSPAEAVYLDACLQDMRDSGEIWEYVNGTSVPNLDAYSLLANKLVVVPPGPVLERYGRFTGAVWDSKYARQDFALRALRDALLPALLSGRDLVRRSGGSSGLLP